jgi:hypothetical protein
MEAKALSAGLCIVVGMSKIPASKPQLDVSSRKGRYGVAYLDAIVTDAGFDLNEPRPGADALAYDANIVYPEGSVRVQIKTTHTYAMSGTNERLTYSATQHWIDSWSASMGPVYFVVVVVPNLVKGPAWIEHLSGGTSLVQTAAFWSRIDPGQFTAGNMAVAALRSQRLEKGTLRVWQQDLIKAYGG